MLVHGEATDTEGRPLVFFSGKLSLDGENKDEGGTLHGVMVE